MTILGGDTDNMGFVGIGTATPTDKLHVEGAIRATELRIGTATLTEQDIGKIGSNGAFITATTLTLGTATPNESKINLIQAPVTSVNTVINLDVDDTSNGGHVNKYAVAQDSSGATTINSALDQDIQFKINNDSEAGVTAITISGSAPFLGSVGIGTSTPTEKLHVEGVIKATELRVGTGRLTENKLVELDNVLVNVDNYLTQANLDTLMLPTFCIWAEEGGDLSPQTDKSGWSFGNGASGYPLERGVVIGVPKCKLISLTLDVGNHSLVDPNYSKVEITRNGAGINFEVATSSEQGTSGYRHTGYKAVDPEDAALIFVGGDTVNFKTLNGGNNTNRGVVCAWFERLE